MTAPRRPSPGVGKPAGRSSPAQTGPRAVRRGGSVPAAGGARRGATAALALAMTLPLALAACSSQTPLDRLRTQLDGFPEYSVVLQDMEAGLFTYTHRYQVLVGQPQPGSDDLEYRETVLEAEVDGATYSRYEPFLGMVILSKTGDGGVDQGAHPPGYQQVGDERYGQWRDDGRGGSFWEFYGQYALLSNLLGGFGGGISRDDWNGYRDSRDRGQTYYGRGGSTYGTNGSATRQSNPDFFRRQQARQATQSRSFGQRVSSRMAGGMRSFGK